MGTSQLSSQLVVMKYLLSLLTVLVFEIFSVSSGLQHSSLRLVSGRVVSGRAGPAPGDILSSVSQRQYSESDTSEENILLFLCSD